MLNKDANVKYEIVPFTRGIGLEVNPNRDQGKVYGHFIGVDEGQLKLFAGGVFDFVYSERLENAKAAWRVIKQGGHLVTLSRDPVKGINNGFDIVMGKICNGRELTVLKKRMDKKINIHPFRRPDKSACIIRYGGIGDMIQTSSIVAGLKAQGYYVAINTDPEGQKIIKDDPNVDEFIIQNKDQVPNVELKPWWDTLESQFGKVVNLCEAVEATFLTMPGRMAHYWPKELRHKHMNTNYAEHMHALAEIPLDIKDRFYPTQKEILWAQKMRKKIGGKAILWTMAGSSVHKTWPFLDMMIARIMLEWEDVSVLLVGDGICKLLERGWENEPRVIKSAGEWEIRNVLALSEMVDLVVGPETGVMAATAMLDIPKIIFMSHSSVENLTKHWVNCASMEPESCECYPCHQMHYGYDPCPRNEDHGTSECQALIDPDKVWKQIKETIE